MAKKRTGLSATLFNGIDPYGKEETEQPAREERLVSLPLTAVRPDPGQPRQLLPENLHAELNEQETYQPLALMQKWLATAPLEDKRLQRLHALADSIARHGLINPITVRPLETERPDGTRYLIVTGERRYWAHVLLAIEDRRIQVGDQPNPNLIQAIIAPEGISIRAHQLIENVNREDINAIEKAQGLVALRQELSGVNRGSPSNQLAPWSEVSKTLGISKRYRIYITSVLKLCAEAQSIIATHDLAEKTVRPIVEKLKDHPRLQVEALNQVVAWQQENASEEDVEHAINSRIVRDLAMRLLAQTDRSARQPHRQTPPPTQKFQRNVRRTLRFFDKLKRDELTLVARDLALNPAFEETKEELQTLQSQLTQIMQQVEDYQSST